MSSFKKPNRHQGSHGATSNGSSSGPETLKDISEDGKPSFLDDKSLYTDYTEDTVVPRRKLGYFQTTALMLNGAFGSFFFSTPYLTLALVRSKRICLVLWAVGGIYSALGMTFILEYGTALPFTGGALIYLDKVFHKPKLLATIVFSFWWILTETTENVAKAIAQSMLSLATGRSAMTLDVRLINLTAIAVQTVVCLLLYFARRFTFTFNTTLAVYRIVLMIVLFVSGMMASRGPNSGLKDFNVDYPGYNGKDALSAMTYIILCYQAYENANYVTGEIRDVKRTMLKSGVTTISLLCVFNVLVTFAFFAVADFETLTTPEGQASTVLLFSKLVFKRQAGMQVAVMITNFSVIIFTTYTASRVKQAIARQRIIPFSRIFSRQDPYYDSPSGGLFLHWIVTVISILCVGNTASDSRQFFSGIYAYGYQLMWIFLALGLFWLPSTMRNIDSNWKPTYLKNRAFLAFVAILFIAINIVILVLSSLPSNPGKVPRFYWAVSTVALVVAALTYWAILRLCEVKGDKRNRLAEKFGFYVYLYKEEDDVPDDAPDGQKFSMYEASLDGSDRRLFYKTSGFIGACLNGINKLQSAFMKFLAW